MPPSREVPFGQVSWERMNLAVEKVQERTLRAAAAMEKAGVPYAIIGGNAVRAHVSKVDPSGARHTVDVDILIRRADLQLASAALAKAGFKYRKVAGIDMFLDGEGAGPRDALHVIFAGEKVRVDYAEAAPDVTESEQADGFRVINLEALVRMKLTSNRRKDQTHVGDMIDVGLVDASWVPRLPPELAARLQHILDTPDG